MKSIVDLTLETDCHIESFGRSFSDHFLKRYYSSSKLVGLLDRPMIILDAGCPDAYEMRVISYPHVIGGFQNWIIPGDLGIDVTIDFEEEQPATCECGSGSNLMGPGHSSWCRRYSV
jgi:hypothetical protein